MEAHDAELLEGEELEEETDAEPLEIEDTEEDELGAEPLIAPPDRRLITQPYDLAVSDLVNQVSGGNLHLNPVYQRRYVWDNKKASKLIESLLINVPIPVCYLAEEADGSRTVIDGQQRLKSLHRFLENQFALRGLEVLPELNGDRFFELTDRQQRLIRNRTIRCIVISEDSHPDIRFDVFERLNTGSVALTAQELRNSVYRGGLNQLLHELAGTEAFHRSLGYRADSRMNFEELALRFFALDERLDDYRPSLKKFLNNYMRDNRNPPKRDIFSKRTRFLATVDKAHAVFGEYCFRRPTATNGDWEWLPTLNSAVYDVVMLNFSRIDVGSEELAQAADELEEMTAELMLEDERFIDAISRATGDRARLRRRVGTYAERLKELGFDSALASLLSPDEE